jgi:hypothetical protein
MEELALDGELAWAASYAGPHRDDPERLEAAAAPLRTALLTSGHLPADADLDALRALAYLQTLPDRPSLGRGWFELLDAVRAHPDARLADLPPARTD